MYATASPARRSATGLVLLAAIGGTMLLTVAGLVIDQPIIALAAPLLVAGLWLIYKVHLKYSVTATLFLLLVCEGLANPLGGAWPVPVLQKVADLLFANLSAITGISPLRAPLADLIFVALLAMSNLRPKEARLSSVTAAVRPLTVTLVLQVATILALYAWGTARGGNFNEALWQFRQMVMLSVRAVVFMRAYDGSLADLKLVGRTVIAAGVVKALIGVYFLRFIAYPQGLDIEFTTSHHDTIIFAPLLALWFNLLIEQFSWRRFVRSSVWAGIVLWGALANDRRLAWVSLGGAIFATLAMSPMGRFKRGLYRMAIVSAPVVALYVAAGWNSNARIFNPAQGIKAMIVGDPSLDYRELENFNVLFTANQQPLLPLGFGHEFINELHLPDISAMMPTWQYHPHNQYLWYFSIAGPIGFTLIFLPLAMAVMLAARIYRRTAQPIERAAAMSIIAVVICVLNQVWGDMGTLGYTDSIMSALVIALASKLAIRTGAWPKPRPKAVVTASTDAAQLYEAGAQATRAVAP